jgi:DNA repair exonuclease SbcCD ATPase subunit
MAPQGYGGPTSLAFSKYASPSMSRALLVTVPAAVSSSIALPNNSIATREQIAASRDESAADAATHNSDAQLAAAQGTALKKEVDKYAAKFSQTLSSAITNTRRLLELIREAVRKEDPSALKAVDSLWVELEQLFAAATNTKDALPNFLEKQRNNMALYHSSMMNETYRESQDELNLQHKKVHLQHGLILEHQQAFQDYKAQTASKLKEIEELQERVSRLTLEKGHFRGEIDKYAKMLELEQVTKAEDLKKAEALQKELDTITTSKKQLLLEIENLQKTIGELHEKVWATEHDITARYATEIQAKSDMLDKESTKTANLNALINTLTVRESSAKQEVAKAKAENKTVTEKYNRMATEHSQTFSVRVPHEMRACALANGLYRRTMSKPRRLRP